MASSSEKIEIERPDPTLPTRKGKGKEETGELEMKRLALECLGSYGQARDSPLMSCVGNLKEDDLAQEGILTMTLVLNLAKQIGSLTANVQYLTRMVHDLNATGSMNTKSGNTGGVAKEKIPEPERSSYPKAAPTTEIPNPHTPAKRGRKRKGSTQPTAPPQPQQKMAREGGATTEPKDDSQGWKTV